MNENSTRDALVPESPGPVVLDAAIVSSEQVSAGLYETVFCAPELAHRARPAQFIAVKVREGRDPFLRRPFSISRVDREQGTVGILWARVGYGTGLMSRWKAEEMVNILGPLGNGFMPGRFGHLVLVAGGTGIAPMPFIMSESLRQCPGTSVTLLYGAKDKGSVYPVARLTQESRTVEIRVSTEDGSFGRKGLVTDLLGEHLEQLLRKDEDAHRKRSEGDYGKSGDDDPSNARNKGSVPNAVVFACGPGPMLSAVKAVTVRAGVPLYVSLEERMGCGVGLCRGCAVRGAGRPENSYLHVCVDGPVFSAEDVDLGGYTFGSGRSSR